MTLFKIEWQTSKKNLFIWSISLVVIIFLMMAIFPSMSNSVMEEMLTSKLDALPENMLKAFHLNSGPSLAETTGFFAYVFQYIFIAASIFAVTLGSKMLVKEETEGTIEYLYAQPISRRQIVLQKGIASVFMLALFWLILYIGSVGSTLLFNQGSMVSREVFQGVNNIFFYESFVLFFFFSFGYLLSSVLKRTNQGISMAIVFVVYLLGIAGDLVEKLEILKKISPMAQTGPAYILENKGSILFISVLFIVSLLLVGLTIMIYERKDLAI